MNLNVLHAPDSHRFGQSQSQGYRGEPHQEPLASDGQFGLTLDPAAQALSDLVLAELHHLGIAVQNVGDALTVVATCDKALSDLGPLFERMGDLALQSKNGTHTADRASLQEQFHALKSQIDAVVKRPMFFGKAVLGERASALAMPIGKEGQEVLIHFVNLTSSGLGLSPLSLLSLLEAEQAVSALGRAITAIQQQRASFEATAAQLFAIADRLASSLRSFEEACAQVADATLMTPQADKLAEEILMNADLAVPAQANMGAGAVAKLLR